MSLSYYRQCLDVILPVIEDFLATVTDLRGNYQMKQDPNLLRNPGYRGAGDQRAYRHVTGRLESFSRSTDDMWRDLDAARFERIERSIQNYHTGIGGVLCALSVKLVCLEAAVPEILRCRSDAPR